MNVSRRKFLQTTATGAAAACAPTILPASVWAATTPPSERVNVGFIGAGGMATNHLHWLASTDWINFVAVADVYDKHVDRALGILKGRGTTGYKDYRKILDRPDIDSVIIATPDHWHALQTIHACQAGKDIYCEKPLSLTLADGRAMVDAVRRYGRVFQTGSQQRCDPRFRKACELVRNGRIGKVKKVDVWVGYGPLGEWKPNSAPPQGLDWDMWLGPAPWVPFNEQRCIYNFRWFWDYSSGKMTDWGAHHLDIARWGLGLDETSGPIRVSGKGALPPHGSYETFHSFEVNYEYPDGTTLVCGNHGNGAKFYGEDGWIFVNRTEFNASDPEILAKPLEPGDERLYDADYGRHPWLNNHKDLLECIKTRKRPICDVQVGYNTIQLCLTGTIAMRLGRELVWDPQRETFVNDAEANRWIARPYRAPYQL